MIPSISYSTGSSAVSNLVSISLTSFNALYRVVVLPEPVGPVTMKIPLGRLTAFLIPPLTSSGKPKLSRLRFTADLSKTRNTTLSPNWVGRVETRRSTALPSIVIFIRPSCGIRCSAIFRSAMTLILEMTGKERLLGGGDISYNAPSTR